MCFCGAKWRLSARTDEVFSGVDCLVAIGANQQKLLASLVALYLLGDL
jgi:hypothetical protein